MSEETTVRGGRYKEVEYSNGESSDSVEPVELGTVGCLLMLDAAKEHWSSVAPPNLKKAWSRKAQ